MIFPNASTMHLLISRSRIFM